MMATMEPGILVVILPKKREINIVKIAIANAIQLICVK